MWLWVLGATLQVGGAAMTLVAMTVGRVYGLISPGDSHWAVRGGEGRSAVQLTSGVDAITAAFPVRIVVQVYTVNLGPSSLFLLSIFPKFDNVELLVMSHSTRWDSKIT